MTVGETAILCLLVAAVPLVLHAGNVAVGHILRRSMRAELRRRFSGRLALTFDDGPGDRLQPKLLQLLAARRAQATFYLLGARLAGREESVRRMIVEGHRVGSHSERHLDAVKRIAPGAARDLVLGVRAVAPLAAGAPLLRPPYGRITITGMLAARRLGARIDLWTVDSGDTRPMAPSVESVVEQVARAGGGVVLLHSHDRGAGRPGEARERFVLEVTSRLLDLAESRGWPIVTMDDEPVRSPSSDHGKKNSASARSGTRMPTDHAM